jgi:hypothetical protein
MKEELQVVTLQQAQRLKELGFNWKVYNWYNPDGSLSNSIDAHERNAGGYSISAPFTTRALKWMREVKKIRMKISTYGMHVQAYGEYLGVDGWNYTSFYGYWDDAESELLDELLTLLEKQP